MLTGNLGWPRSPAETRPPLAPNCRGVLRHARDGHPDVSQCIARTEAQGLFNVSLRFFGATHKDLASSNKGMGMSEISIKRHRVLAFRDSLRGAPGEHGDNSQVQMCARMVWDRRQGFGQLCFSCNPGRHRVSHKEMCALDRVRDRRSNERVDIVGVGGEGAIEKAARLHDIVRGPALVKPSQTLKIEVYEFGVGACCARRASAAISWAFNASARRATISSCISKRSARGLSNRSAQR